jgi:hypothetical protein
MIIVKGDRCSGKSTRAREYVRNHANAVLVVKSHCEADTIRREESNLLGRCSIEVISMSEFFNRHDAKIYVIDELDRCFSAIGKRVEMVTATADLEVLKVEFEHADDLLRRINRMGLKAFNEAYPAWSIKY